MVEESKVVESVDRLNISASLTSKLIVRFLFGVMFPLVALFVISYIVANSVLEEEVAARIIGIAEEKTYRIEEFVKHRIEEATSLAVTPSIVGAFGKLENAFKSSGPDSEEYLTEDRRIRSILPRIMTQSDYYDIIFISLSGDIFYTFAHEKDFGANLKTGELAETELANAFNRTLVKSEPMVSGYSHYPPSKSPAPFIAVPVIIGQKLTGVLAIQLPAEPFLHIVQDYRGLGKSGETVVGKVAEGGALVVLPLRNQPDAAFRLIIKDEGKSGNPVVQAANGAVGHSITYDYRDRKVLAAWRPLPYFSLGMVVKIDADEVFARRDQLRNLSMALSAMALLIVLLLGGYVYRTVSIPLLALTAASRRISDGDLDINLDIRSGDEIGALAGTLNKMAGNLKYKRDHMEEEVRLRTAELDEHNMALVKSETRLAKAQAVARIGNWEYDFITDDFFCSDELANIFGLSTDWFDTTLKEFQALIHPDDFGFVEKSRAESVALKQPFDIVYRICLGDGRIKYVNEHCETFFNDNGDPLRTVGAVQDITERHLATEERNRLSIVVEQAAEAIAIADTEGVIKYVNPSFERITGYAKENALGKNLGIVVDQNGSGVLFSTILVAINNAETWRGELTFTRGLTEEVELESSITPVLGADGKVENIACILRDITREATLERQVSQSQKMQAIGTLAGGIAHDFNNILTAVMGFVELVQDELPEKQEAYNDLGEALKGCHRAKDLIQQILVFSRQSETEFRPIHMSMVVSNTLKLIRATFPVTIKIVEQIENKKEVILADETQITQVVLNLCNNAEHAMHNQGGVLAVTVKSHTVDSEFAELHKGLAPGPYVLVTIGDTGKGIDRYTLKRIFEPFFTTKIQGEGTGLGLSVVHGIMEAHGGLVTVYSEVGKGAMFHLYFPRVDRNANDDEEEKNEIVTQSGRVLFVDDEKHISIVAKRALTTSGFDVTATTDPVEALEIFARDPLAYDIIVTDHTMPAMTGVELAIKARQLRSDIPVVLTTGYSMVIDEKVAAECGVCELVIKPFNKKELVTAIVKGLNG